VDKQRLKYEQLLCPRRRLIGAFVAADADPIAVLAAVQPELFTFARGWVRVNSEGVTSLERHDAGPHRMVVDLDTTVVAQQVLSRICRAQTGQNVGPT